MIFLSHNGLHMSFGKASRMVPGCLVNEFIDFDKTVSEEYSSTLVILTQVT